MITYRCAGSNIKGVPTTLRPDAHTVSKIKLATEVEGNLKAPFSIATTPWCRGGRYSFPWIAPLSP